MVVGALVEVGEDSMAAVARTASIAAASANLAATSPLMTIHRVARVAILGSIRVAHRVAIAVPKTNPETRTTHTIRPSVFLPWEVPTTRPALQASRRDYNTYNANQQAEQQSKYNEANSLQHNQEETSEYEHTQSMNTVNNNVGNTNWNGGGGGSNNGGSSTGEALGAAALGAVGGMAVGLIMTSAAQP